MVIAITWYRETATSCGGRQWRPLFVGRSAMHQPERDLTEKEHQVERMTQIYQNPSMTIIWLGKDSSGDAIKLLDMIERVQSILRNPKNIQSPATGLNNKESENLELLKHGVLDWVHPITRRLLQRPWFECVWVFQESVASAKVVFLLGTNHTISHRTK